MRLAIPRRRLPETPLEKLQFEQANAQSDAEWPKPKLTNEESEFFTAQFKQVDLDDQEKR